MAALKCPNPVCPFRFDPKSVPAGATLACPRCDTRFTLGDSGVVAPPRAESNPPRASRRGPLAAGTSTAVVAVTAVLVLAAVGAVTAITLASRNQKATRVGGPAELIAVEENFAVTPPAGWVADPGTQNALGVNAFCYRSPTGQAWVALAVRDYETRAPFVPELAGVTRAALDKAFVGVARDLNATPATLGGEPAEKSPFRGEARGGGTPCVGEVTVLSHKGVAYWFFAWAAETDAAGLAADLDRARDSFRLLGGRNDWTPRVAPETVFRSVKDGSLFALSTTDPAWARADGLDPAAETPPAELLLAGRVDSAGDRRAAARAAVFVLDPAGDPQAQAEALVRARHSPDPKLFGPTAIEPAAGDVQGEPASPGEVPPTLAVTRLTARATGAGASASSDKLVVFSVAALGGKVVVAETTCPLNERAIWERRLVQLVGSLGANR